MKSRRVAADLENCVPGTRVWVHLEYLATVVSVDTKTHPEPWARLSNGMCHPLSHLVLGPDREKVRLTIAKMGGDSWYPAVQPEDLTCFTCVEHDQCASAWDLYNTDGDCLEEK